MLKKLLVSFIVVLIIALPTTAGAATPRWFQPLLSLPRQTTIHCILFRESRSTLVHPNISDKNPYQYGPFQFTPILWNRWSWVAGVGSRTAYWYLGSQAFNAVTIPAYAATLYQQAKVFAVVDRNDGLGMWTEWDGCA